MRELVRDYNRLLERTFVDIPKLNEPVIIIPPKRPYDNQPAYLSVRTRSLHAGYSVTAHGNKMDGSMVAGGSIPSEYREDIYINNEPTVEIDYSSLHAVLVYQRKGIDYWKEIKTDPYQTNIKGLADKESRAIGKCVLLFSFNLTDETTLLRAVKDELQQKIPQYRFTFDNLRKVMNKLREMHPHIEEDIL